MAVFRQVEWEPRYLDVDGARLAYYLSGQGENPVVWLHGLPLDSRSWSAQRAHFDPLARNIFVDLRGYGGSSKLPPNRTDITQLYADDLGTLLTHLGLREVAVIGFASAGHVALRFAAQHPQRLAKLAVINASPRFRRGDDWPWGFDDATINQLVRTARDGGIEAITDLLLDPATVFRDVGEDQAHRLKQWFAEMSRSAGTDTLMGFVEGISRDDDRHLLRSIATSTLVVSSAIGREVPSDVGLYLRERIGKSCLVEIAGADHFVFATRPLLLNMLLAQFLSTAPQAN
ncbi:alpha/beta hydrolase [Mycobacterium sp.]|jgi:pimeloyl-ACP methyl ester carboxylesterase|uniref:alpha/beta fold hydrolase n=1 Tax=Mycobacterium sp. TaxID=1785 RepID=UPI0028BA76C3|nr:hydrolase superfamily protein YdjP [Mycobacterium sp.]MDT5056664.1 non-heme chloroperoxidase [Mycobacterium sp.]